ncbi:uncharacterized protein CCR75_005081 [Bremia lactucae]|uniref:FYVE-type domain-containing protein n=1 Tax=Bremia lactucae TaxID=4779 RepID=A0A976IMC5_BRELC|nr:hypothetical protein CCR75_005081 [Bremia lactucae]
MRFPLPADTFPTLVLSEEDRHELQTLSEGFVHSAIDEYTTFRFTHKCILDKEQWKVVKTRDAMTSYRDLRGIGTERSQVFTHKRLGSSVMTSSTKTLGLLAFGTIEGEFDDMAYGLINGSTELLKIKASYTNDKIVDCKVLATIVEPSPKDPVRGMFLKWSVSMGASCLLRNVVRPRDFVYLESVGSLQGESGERIGYSLVHSLQISTIRELFEYQIVRASTSICVLFRQKTSGKIELYVKGFVDAMGSIQQGVAVSITADALMSFSNIVHCGQMKKLHWLWMTRKTIQLDPPNTQCIICSHVPSRPQLCGICLNIMCSRCSVTKKLCFLSATTRQVSQRSVVFCIRCLLAGLKADALKVAADEVIRQNPLDSFDISTNSTPSSRMVSPSSTNPPDATREFFG